MTCEACAAARTQKFQARLWRRRCPGIHSGCDRRREGSACFEVSNPWTRRGSRTTTRHGDWNALPFAVAGCSFRHRALTMEPCSRLSRWKVARGPWSPAPHLAFPKPRREDHGTAELLSCDHAISHSIKGMGFVNGVRDSFYQHSWVWNEHCYAQYVCLWTGPFFFPHPDCQHDGNRDA
jgi:hypothetical protein